MLVGKRAVLLVPSPSATSLYGQKHPYIVITDACDVEEYAAQSVLMVSVSSVKEGQLYDPTCVLEPGCSSAITKLSAVQYGIWKFVPSTHVDDCIKNGVYIVASDLSPELTNKVSAGIYRSQFTPPWVKQVYSTVTSSE